MKSMNDNTVPVQQDANLYTFHKRNKILILISLFLILSLTVVLGVLITHVVHNNPPSVNPAVKAFCLDTPSCLKAFNPIISVKSRIGPSQIFTLSLQTAAKQLENVINDKTAMIGFENCSSSLRVGLGRIRDALATMRVDPFVEMQSNEQRAEMMNKIDAVEENLNSCLDDLGSRAESTAVISEVTAKVQEVMVYVNRSGDFLLGYPAVLRRFDIDDYIGGDRGVINLEIEKHDAFSKLGKRNKTTITILTSFIISLALIIGALITYLVQEDTSKLVPYNNPLLFYSAPCNVPPCWRVHNTIITTAYITDPAKIFTLTLQKSIEDLETLVSLIDDTPQLDELQQMKMRANKTMIAFNNCSDSLRNGSGQIQPLFLVNPFIFGAHSDEQRGETIKRIIAAEENLEACVRDLEKAEESTAVIEVREKVLRVKEYLSSSRDNLFTYEHDVVWDKFWGDFVAKWGVMFGVVVATVFRNITCKNFLGIKLAI
ncbi:hypothetical protein PHJA_002080800 [Phtheirospermum japonicum]|uniref:Pectinesterase inhibitor domain-containing protein n=1 Tax=Phtheirospermum japonicum TaxID=374723 RepID=A0A830CF29_9LAMI|nr:hypothetical protein PHJA_002080800 [Phtheirospermum japonicum]